ncbi:MAG: DUF1576 domain-containing protein [Clostridia bacterium]|nr:DUF1576 domain-containing protein [Clostridia bacterium]
MGLAFFFNTPTEIWMGSIVILTSPANLITDYFALANIGATLMNAGFMTLTSLVLVRVHQVKMTGAIVAAIFTVAGFSFFGKNIYNSIPIILGVMLYARIVRLPFNRFMLQALFGTALGPLPSEITFNLGLPLAPGLILGFSAGILAGLVLPPLSAHFLRFHQGFSLYNIGFTAGIVGMFFLAILQGFGIEITTVAIVSSGNDLVLAVILGTLFSGMLLFGLMKNNWRLTGYRQFLNQPGKLASDFITISGAPLTLINMAFLGLMATSYVLAVGGEINGPVIGGIFTVVGFGAFGKHVKNVWPILVGVFLGNLFHVNDLAATSSLLTALFGTTLAPIAGYYGPFYGIVAGMLHMAMVSNISYLHAGMNLYNNGFTGGFIAAALVPLFDAFKQVQSDRKEAREHE